MRVTSPVILAIVAAITLFLAVGTDDGGLSEDAAHYLSGAKNLSQGNGYSTDIIYYDRHHTDGRIPATQTIWPPGMSISIMMIEKVTGNFTIALLWLSYLGVGLSIWFLFAQLRLAGVPIIFSLLTSALFSTSIHMWELAARGASATPMMAACLGLTNFLIAAESSRLGSQHVRYLVIASICASLAFLFHYTAFFFLLGVGLYTLTWVKTLPTRLAFQNLLLLWTLPLLTGVSVFFRSLVLAGDISERPGGSSPATLTETLRAFAWALDDIMGVSLTSITNANFFALVAVTGIVVLFTSVTFFTKAHAHPKKTATFFSTFPEVLFATIIVTAAASFTFLSVSYGSIYISARYLFVYLPIFLLVITLIVWRLVGSKPPRRYALIILASAAAIFLPQINVAQNTSRFDLTKQKTAVIDRGLSEIVCDRPVRQWIAESQTHGHPVFANHGQLFWLRSHFSTVTLPSDVLSNRTWNSLAAMTSARAFKVQYVLLFKALLRNDPRYLANRTFFADLIEQMPVQGLSVVYESDTLIIAEMENPAIRGKGDISLRQCLTAKSGVRQAVVSLE